MCTVPSTEICFVASSVNCSCRVWGISFNFSTRHKPPAAMFMLFFLTFLSSRFVIQTPKFGCTPQIPSRRHQPHGLQILGFTTVHLQKPLRRLKTAYHDARNRRVRKAKLFVQQFRSQHPHRKVVVGCWATFFQQ